jgi:D-alanyl-D-alanine carboxypeptidase
MRHRPIIAAIPLAAALSSGVFVGLFGAAQPAGAPSTTPGPLTSPSPAPAAAASASPAAPSPSTAPASPTRAPGVRAIPADELQARLDGIRARAGIPGVSVSILWPDGRSWTGVSGLADVASRRKVRPETPFAVASISKTYTAALVLQLVEEGRLDLDEPALSYLPGVKVDRSITIRQLLDHTSGLYDYFLNTRIDRALRTDPDRWWTPTDALRYVRKPYAKPGEGFFYSNTNYLLLGLIAERVTGRPVAVEIRERFLDPLGLETTFYQAVERPPSATARGYRFNGSSRTARPIDLSDGTEVRPFRSVISAAGAAGSIAASSRDVARWAQALYGGKVLGEESLRVMLAAAALHRRVEPIIPYGLGVQEVVIGRWPTYGHSGRFLGFRASMRYLPQTGVSIAVLTNQSRTDPSGIVAALLNIVFPLQEPCRGCQ